MYRRSRSTRASFQAKNAFSGVPTGKALAPRRVGNEVIDRTRTDTVPAIRRQDWAKMLLE